MDADGICRRLREDASLQSSQDPRDRLRRDLDSILQMWGVMVSGYQLHQLVQWFDAELEDRAELRRRADERMAGLR